MFFKSSKQCFRCQEVKSTEDFYRDSKSKDKRRASCKICEEGKKRAVVDPKAPQARGIGEGKEAGLRKKASDLLPKIQDHTASMKDLHSIREKHQSFLNLCVNANGTARLQVFSNPIIIYKGESVEEVLRMALA